MLHLLFSLLVLSTTGVCSSMDMDIDTSLPDPRLRGDGLLLQYVHSKYMHIQRQQLIPLDKPTVQQERATHQHMQQVFGIIIPANQQNAPVQSKPALSEKKLAPSLLRKLACTICAIQLETHEEKTQHDAAVHKTCAYCPFLVSTITGLKNHLRKTHHIICPQTLQEAEESKQA